MLPGDTVSPERSDVAAPARRALQRTWFGRLLRNRLGLIGAIILVTELAIAVLAPALTPFDPFEQDLRNRMLPPGADGHLLGTDEFGRDQFSRILLGTRYSLLVGATVVIISFVLGVPAGAIAGYYRWADGPIMRLVDLMLAFPQILLALIVVATLGTGLFNVMIAVGLASAPAFARLTRGVVLSLREADYVTATQSLGSNDGRVIVRHILPNTAAPLIVQSTFRVATGILSAAALSFLGLGAEPPTPEWGAMLSTGRTYLFTSPHLSIYPGIAIFITVLGFNILGDGLRDVLDPRIRR
ncbi:MAG: ABC transporter permease [Truepera sp.]|nr:ABC transporter permease [Truepera sp.]